MSGRGRFLSASWAALPEALKARLLLGSTGRLHLPEAAAAAAGSRPRTAAADPVDQTCADILLWTLGESPLDGNLARDILDLPRLRPFFPARAAEALEHLARNWNRPGNLAYYQRLAELRDLSRMRAYLESQVKKSPGSLFWRHQVLIVGLFENDFQWLESNLDLGGLGLPQGLAAAQACQLAQAKGDPGRALDLAQDPARDLEQTFGPGFAAARRGLILLAAGERGPAAGELAQALGHCPWQTSLALVLHDLAQGLDQERADLPGQVAALLYSWNKCRDLDAALDSVRRSDPGPARLFVLDNGSSDQTAEVIKRWRDRFGRDRFEALSLPVNIGAPAARNWLMSLPGVRECEFAAYLDDDAEPPADWLGRLGSAVRRYPQAGVWGCRVVDHSSPYLAQSTDLHLSAPPDTAGPDMDLSSLTPNPFTVTDLQNQTLDLGLFNYLRPCASVTGCCHLFRTADLAGSGGFSLRLSPSQFDDLELDLRLAASGRFAVFQGHLAVRHKKRSGLACHVSRAEMANALGNKYKLQAMHPKAEVRAVIRAEQKLLAADLGAKMSWIEDNLDCGPGNSC